MSSVSGSVLAGYAGVGVELKYLIAASFMAAPAGFLMAKMMIPETEKPRNDLTEVEVDDQSANVIDAAATGASSGLQLAMNVGAMLLAFVAPNCTGKRYIWLGRWLVWLSRADFTRNIWLCISASRLCFRRELG